MTRRTHTNTCTDMHIHLYMHTDTYICIQTHTHAHTYHHIRDPYMYTHARANTCIHAQVLPAGHPTVLQTLRTNSDASRASHAAAAASRPGWGGWGVGDDIGLPAVGPQGHLQGLSYSSQPAVLALRGTGQAGSSSSSSSSSSSRGVSRSVAGGVGSGGAPSAGGMDSGGAVASVSHPAPCGDGVGAGGNGAQSGDSGRVAATSTASDLGSPASHASSISHDDASHNMHHMHSMRDAPGSGATGLLLSQGRPNRHALALKPLPPPVASGPGDGVVEGREERGGEADGKDDGVEDAGEARRTALGGGARPKIAEPLDTVRQRGEMIQAEEEEVRGGEGPDS